MITNPRILITNDDGIDAPGLQVMIKIARAMSDDVHVLAPVGNQSGVGHQLTFGKELELIPHGENVYGLAGSPADCVVIGITHLLRDKKPDIVLSGVNNGQNLGDIIHCSGTAAGAREGALHGILAIALSQAVDYELGHDVDWAAATMHGEKVVRAILDAPKASDVYYNVNFPLGAAEEITDLKVVPHQRFAESPFGHYPSKNEGKFFVAIPKVPQPLNPEHDFHVLHHERTITVTPLKLTVTDFEKTALLDAQMSGPLSNLGR